jgi:hypothetical protein
MAAHKLAKLALSLGEERVWKEDYPMCVKLYVKLYVKIIMSFKQFNEI